MNKKFIIFSFFCFAIILSGIFGGCFSQDSSADNLKLSEDVSSDVGEPKHNTLTTTPEDSLNVPEIINDNATATNSTIFNDINETGVSGSSGNFYDTKYEVTWKSEDGNFEFTSNNEAEMHGRGAYKGTYILNGETYDVEFCNEGRDCGIYSEDKDGLLYVIRYIWASGEIQAYQYIIHGEYIIDDRNGTFIVTVDDVDNNFNVSEEFSEFNDLFINPQYEVGDKIVFHKVT